MLKSTVVYNRPSRVAIFYNKLILYLRVGWMLHIASISGLILFYYSVIKTLHILGTAINLQLALWIYLCCFWFVVVVVSLIDGYGRFQNYKQVKDLLYQYGFDKRFLRPFISSRCQRNAVLEAARSTNHKQETIRYFKTLGYKWYHIFPDAFVKNPLVLFTTIFWKRILVTKYYKMQYFYW